MYFLRKSSKGVVPFRNLVSLESHHDVSLILFFSHADTVPEHCPGNTTQNGALETQKPIQHCTCNSIFLASKMA